MYDYMFPWLEPQFLDYMRAAPNAVASLDRTPDIYGFGRKWNGPANAPDKGTPKGMGFNSIYYEVPGDDRPGYMSEYSLGPEYFNFPAVYPGMSLQDLSRLAELDTYNRQHPFRPQRTPETIYRRAFDSALSRVASGVSPFWQPGEDTKSMLIPDVSRLLE